MTIKSPYLHIYLCFRQSIAGLALTVFCPVYVGSELTNGLVGILVLRHEGCTPRGFPKDKQIC